MEVYGWLSMGRHRCLERDYCLTDRCACVVHSPPVKTRDTKHRKCREVDAFEYEWCTAGAVNNWEVLDY